MQRSYECYNISKKSELCEICVVLCPANGGNKDEGYKRTMARQYHKAEIKEGIDMLDEIVRNGAISDTSLRMLVKKISSPSEKVS